MMADTLTLLKRPALSQVLLRACFSIPLLLSAGNANAVLDLQPFETFVCEGVECEPDFARTGGNGGSVNGRILRSRSTGAAFQTDKDEAEAGVRFRVCAPTVATITVNGSYQGLLRGVGGGINNRGLMDIELVLRNVDANTVVERLLIKREEERGEPVAQTINSPVSSFFAFGEGENGATIEVELEPNTVFSAGMVLQTEASGVNALSDFNDGFRQAVLNAISIKLRPDLPDSDGDGLFDEWETNGLRDCDGNVLVGIHEMGADPNRKDIFVEYDWVSSRAPSKETLDLVKARFAASPVDGGQGIRLWFDTGDLTEFGLEEQGGGPGSCLNTLDDDGDGLVDAEDSDCLIGDNLGGGNEIPVTDIPNGRDIPRIGGDSDNNGIADFREVKDEHFDSARRPIFHYVIQGPKGLREADLVGTCDDGIDNDGDGLVDSEDEDDCFTRSQAGSGANFIVLNDTPTTLMHELGHSMGLGHGGRSPDNSSKDITNCKPNYLSVMNYFFSRGVPADLDGDGVFESETIDFSPITIPGGRAAAPLDDLFEGDLDETTPLDATDPVHATRFTDAMGIGQTSAVNEGLNWDGEGAANATGVVANIDGGDENGLPADCLEQSDEDADPDGETLTGHDDWGNLVYRFNPDTPIESGAIEPIPEPDLDADAIELAFNSTDLSIAKEVDKPLWVGGQQVAYRITVTNNGPNGVKQATVRDNPAPGVIFTALPENCTPQPGGALECGLPPLPVGESHDLDLHARLPLFPDCGEDQITRIFNSASVNNRFGNEIDTANNQIRLEHEVLCPAFEYPAKMICGKQTNPEDLSAILGAYGTTINVHNPNDERVHVFIKLAMARPPGELEPGPVLPIDLVSFDYDEAFAVDCEAVKKRLFDGVLPEPLLDGFLVLQSARRIDVTGVYSSASVNADGQVGAHSSLDIEDIRRRRLRPPQPLPDLTSEQLAIDSNCDNGECRINMRFQVENTGEAYAEGFTTSISLQPGDAIQTSVAFANGLNVGESQIGDAQFTISLTELQRFKQICVDADEPADNISEEDEENNTSCRDLP